MIPFPVPRYPVLIGGILFLVFGMPQLAHAFLWNDIEVTPRVALGETYDDNVTFSKNDEVSDFITSALFGVGFKQEGKTHNFAMDVEATQELFADNSSYNNLSESMNVRYSQELSKYDLIKVTDIFSNSEEPRSFADAFGRTSGRYFTLRNVLGLDYRHDFSEQWAWNMRYANDLTNYTRNDLSDSTMNSVGTSLDYAFNSENILSANYDWNQRNFDPGPSATENELSVNGRHFFTSQIYLDVRGGADFIQSYNDAEYTKPLVRVSLTNDIDETTQTGISFEKQYTTTAYTQDLFDIWRVSVRVIKQLTSRFAANFNAFYGKGTYKTTDIEEDLTGASAGISYDLNKSAKLNLNYSFSQDDSTDPANSYTKNVVYLGATFTF